SISEPAPGLLDIDLGANTFDPTSTAAATGLTYETGAPGTSHSATLDIGRVNNVRTLQATLPGAALALGDIKNTSGGLGSAAASAGVITVTGLNTGANFGSVDLKSAGALTVAPNAVLDTETAVLALAADVNADGTGNSNSDKLFIARGATVMSGSPNRD